MKSLLLFLVMQLLNCSCVRKEERFLIHGGELSHDDAVLIGYSNLPVARAIRTKYGAWSFITHFNMSTRGLRDFEKEWQTVTVVNGRYEVAYLQKIVMDAERGILPLGDGVMYIKEMTWIDDDREAPGTRYSNNQFTLNAAQIKKLIESDWDYASVGITENRKPLKRAEWLAEYWNRIYPKQAH